MPEVVAFEPLLDSQSAAALLNIHPVTLLKWARERRIPSLRYGRSVRFRVSALNEWLESQTFAYDLGISRAASTLEREAA